MRCHEGAARRDAEEGGLTVTFFKLRLPWWRRALNFLRRHRLLSRRRYEVKFDSIAMPRIKAPFPALSIRDLVAQDEAERKERHEP